MNTIPTAKEYLKNKGLSEVMSEEKFQLRFYKEPHNEEDPTMGRSWYADIPGYIESGGSKADCLMVAGADTWLDFLSLGSDEVLLEFANDQDESNSYERLLKVSEDNESLGATYIALTYCGHEVSHTLWVCPVTLFVFGEYPLNIFYKVVSKN